MKTNKSYSKRLRVTKTGKVLSRKAGQNHFNAKESGRKQLQKGRSYPFVMTAKSKSRFLAQSGLARKSARVKSRAQATKVVALAAAVEQVSKAA